MHLFFEENKRKRFKKNLLYFLLTIFKNCKKEEGHDPNKCIEIYLTICINPNILFSCERFQTQATSTVHSAVSRCQEASPHYHSHGSKLRHPWRLRIQCDYCKQPQVKHHEVDTRQKQENTVIYAITKYGCLTTF